MQISSYCKLVITPRSHVLALNSFAGVNPSDTLPIDHSVIALKQFIPLSDEIDNAITSRPEYRIAKNKIELQESSRKIADAHFLPQFHIGVDGSYSSPGYKLQIRPRSELCESTPSSVSRSSNGENVRVPATLPRTPSIWLNRISARRKIRSGWKYKPPITTIKQAIDKSRN